MSSLLLDQTYWDLCVDAMGNIAVAEQPYSIAQDVACACRLVKGELWYNNIKGVPYFDEILGHLPTEDALRQYLADAALSVPEVESATVVIASFDGRSLTGQIQFTDIYGNTNNVGF